MSSRRALGLLLRLYPSSFRRSFGDEMLDVFTQQVAETRRRAGWVATLRLWTRTCFGVTRAALLERAEARRPGSPEPSSRLPRKERVPMDRLVQDVRYGFRTLLRNPGFTAIAVLTLALGIGINTVVFSLVNAFLMRPLPHVEEPARLVAMFTGEGGDAGVSAYMDYVDIAERATTLDGFAAYKPLLMDFAGGGDTERVQGMIVSANYFEVLGVRPAHGRFFAPADDDEPDGETVAVLGHALWLDRFAGDASIVGRTVVLNGRTFDVIGIAPPDFRGTFLESRPQVFAPMMMQPHFMPASGNLLNRRGWGGILTVGRLADGVTIEQASDDVAAIGAWIAEVNPEIANWGREYGLVGVQEGTLIPEQRSIVVQFSTLLMGVMALVLAVACVNIANLMLARSVQRRPELAVRQALGADRAGLFRQLLVESVTLSAMGGAAGLVLAYWSQNLLSAMPFPFELDLGFDARVLGFAAVASVLTGVVFGLLPALRATRVDVADRMRKGTAGTARVGRRSLANTLVAAQVALSIILLIAAGLFLRTLVGLGSVDLGFDADNVLVATVDPGLQGYEGGGVKSFYDRLVPRVEAVAGVERVSMVSALPGPDNDDFWSASIEGYTPGPDERVGAFINYVAAGYFQTMGIPIVQGRGFSESDPLNAMYIVINETAAAMFADRTGRAALGGRMGFEGPDGQFAEIIGIAADSKVASLRADPRPQVYLPHAQLAAMGMGARMTLLVRTGDLDPLSVLAGVRAAVVDTDPNVPVFEATTLEDHLSSTLFQERLSVALLGFSAALSLLLASVGLYGVLAYAVAQRTKEMGIRMALGAHTVQVRRLVVRQGMVVVAVGAAIGLAGAFAASSLMSGFLYGVAGTDPVTYVAVIVLLGIVSLVAAYVPARRATRVDPLSALRTD